MGKLETALPHRLCGQCIRIASEKPKFKPAPLSPGKCSIQTGEFSQQRISFLQGCRLSSLWTYPHTCSTVFKSTAGTLGGPRDLTLPLSCKSHFVYLSLSFLPLKNGNDGNAASSEGSVRGRM